MDELRLRGQGGGLLEQVRQALRGLRDRTAIRLREPAPDPVGGFLLGRRARGGGGKASRAGAQRRVHSGERGPGVAHRRQIVHVQPVPVDLREHREGQRAQRPGELAPYAGIL